MSSVTLEEPLEIQSMLKVGQFKTKSCHSTSVTTSPMPWALKTSEGADTRNAMAKACFLFRGYLKDLSSHQTEDSPGAADDFLSASPGV